MSVDALRREIIANSRIVSLRRHFDSRVSKGTFAFPVMRDHYRSLFFCGYRETFPGISHLCQNAAFLLSHVLEHPALFAEAIVNCTHEFDCSVLILETIPSLYGFFSSNEQLNFAVEFYKSVVQLAEPEVAIRMIEPFFNSTATFRFREHAFDQFFRGFLLDVSVTAEKDLPSLVPIHSLNLLDALSAALPLLPKQHLELLRILRRPSFPSVQFTRLFLIDFLWASAIDWLQSLHFGKHVQFLRRVLREVGHQKQALRRFYAELDQTVCAVDVPNLFVVFDHAYLLYFFSVNDILFVAQILGDQKRLPRGLTRADFGDIDERYRDSWFWCQVFPKVEPPPHEPPVRLDVVFGRWIDDGARFCEDTETSGLVGEAIEFERFLEYKDQSQRVKQWGRLVQTEVTQLMRIYIEYFSGIRPSVLPLEIRQLLEIRELNPEVVTRHRRRLMDQADSWNKIAANYRAKTDLKRMLADRPATRNLVWDGIRRIMYTADPDLRGFPWFILSIVQFHIIALELDLGTPLLCGIIAQMPCEALLVPFTLIAGTVGQDVPEFLSAAQNLAWDAIGACIMKMAQEDTQFFRRFIAEIALIRKR
jgi:hypothetical protein